MKDDQWKEVQNHLRAKSTPPMTLRQHYAGLAMSRLAADFGPVPAATIAKKALELADALIAAEKESKS